MTVAVVGGAGQIARLLHPLLLAAGHEPLALVRRPEQIAEFSERGIRTRRLDIENASVADFVTALEGADAVVFAAGGGADGNLERKRTVDLEGATKSIAAAEQVGIERFLQVSAIGVDADPDPDAGEVWTAYVRAKRDADAALRASSLAWTILRPGGLTDEPGTGRVALAPHLERGSIPRADVAATLVAALDDDRTIGRQWELVSGEETIERAIENAVG